MSKRKVRASGRFIEDLARPLNGLPEVGILDWFGFQEIYTPPEQMLEILQQTEEAVRMFGGRHRLELHQEVEVTGRRIEVVPGGGAEEVQPLDPVLDAETLELLDPLLDCGVHSGTSL